MKRLGIALLAAANLVVATPTYTWAATNPAPSSLKEIVTIAVNENPAIVELQKRYAEKQAGISVATSLPNPKFGIMKDDIPTTSLNPFDGMMTEFSLSQEIMYPGKLKLMGKMADADAEMARSTYQDKQLQIYAETKQAYYDLLYATKAVEIGKENQELMKQIVQVAQANYTTGMVSLQDVLRAQTEVSKMSTDLVSMAAMETIARAKINNLMGKNTDEPLAIREEFNAPPPNFDAAVLPKTALTTKPALIGMQNQVLMATSNLELARKQSKPDFEIEVGYKTYKQMEMNPRPDDWRIGIMAMLPIWGDKNKGQIAAATAGLDAAKASLANMQNMAALDVSMALTEAQSAWRQIDLYKNTIIPQAEQTYQASVGAYASGKADFMAVLDSLNASRNAKLDYYKAKVNYEKTAATLEKAVGKPLFLSLNLNK